MFDSLLDESRLVKKKAAEAEAKGRVEEIEALRQLILGIVQTRFPALAQLAQQKVATLSEPKQFHGLIMQIAMARDEAATRELLRM